MQASELARSFAWPDVVRNVLTERLTNQQIRQSLLVDTRGYDSDFTGHGCWELAARMLSSKFAQYRLPLNLRPRSACEA